MWVQIELVGSALLLVTACTVHVPGDDQFPTSISPLGDLGVGRERPVEDVGATDQWNSAMSKDTYMITDGYDV